MENIKKHKPIKNAEYLELNLVKKYSDKSSPYNIYLYKNRRGSV